MNATSKSAPLPFGLIPRILALALLFAVELLILSMWLDNASLIAQGGILSAIGQSGAWIVRGVVGFAAIFFTFAYLQKSAALADVSRDLEGAEVGWAMLAVHLSAMGAFGLISRALYGKTLSGYSPDAAALLWLATGALGIGFGAVALIPRSYWIAIVRATGWLWAFSLGSVMIACVVGAYSRSAWGPLVGLTFTLTKASLGLFVSQVVSNPAKAILGTPKFRVEIAPECSGFEGAGLILAFGVVWLWMFRKECRFPQALLLLPAGVVAIFLLNTVRLTALILIGDAGAPEIALGGFHSQAGWISFNIVALALAVAARRLSWFSTASGGTLAAYPHANLEGLPDRTLADTAAKDNPAEIYLAPFLSILVFGMLATAVSAGFEWLYPIRFVAVLGVLWIYRAKYAEMNWRFGWFGFAMGLLVFALWMGCDFLFTKSPHDAMPKALAAASPGSRTAWIALRALAATVTVPIAEELAFRGFLIRRVIASDVQALPGTSYTVWALFVSSVAFGMMHGNMWFAGILAGAFYAWAFVRQGRIGEAVIAHATTNALLAAYVLTFQKWHLW